MHTYGNAPVYIEETPCDARIVVNKDTSPEIVVRIGHPPKRERLEDPSMEQPP